MRGRSGQILGPCEPQGSLMSDTHPGQFYDLTCKIEQFGSGVVSRDRRILTITKAHVPLSGTRSLDGLGRFRIGAKLEPLSLEAERANFKSQVQLYSHEKRPAHMSSIIRML